MSIELRHILKVAVAIGVVLALFVLSAIYAVRKERKRPPEKAPAEERPPEKATAEEGAE